MSGRQTSTWIAAVVLLGLLGLSILYAIYERGRQGQMNAKPLSQTTDFANSAKSNGSTTEDKVASNYIEALQHDRCEEVIGLTWWMKERLDYVTSRGEDIATAKSDLCTLALERRSDEAMITSEGIHDKYIFPPGAIARPLRSDAGLDYLAKPVSYRLWFEVSYEGVELPPRGSEGRPITKMRVGLNVSDDGYILKAGVLGTAEVNEDSIVYARESERN